jgi:hypothetical protein
MESQQLWVITAEIIVQGHLSPGEKKGFYERRHLGRLTENSRAKASEVLKSYGWQVLGIKAARPFDDSRSYEDDLLDIVDRARSSPSACIIGTVFSYKPD